MSNKRSVQYDVEQDVVIELGRRAFVFPIDHTDSENVSNTTHVLTSPVVKYDKQTGVFETENSIYHPVKK